MTINRTVGFVLGAALLLGTYGFNQAYAAPFMIVGNDEKVLFDDEGKVVLSPAGKDSVLIVDLETRKIQKSSPICR